MSGKNERKIISDTEILLYALTSIFAPRLYSRDKELMLEEEHRMLKEMKNPEFNKEINEVKKKYDRSTWDTNFKGSLSFTLLIAS
jgi:hypothetical protein